MAINFKESAAKKAAERGGSPLMEGRTVLKNDMVIALYPDGVTIMEAEVYHGTDDKGQPYDMAVYLIAEDETKVCKSGKVLVNIFKEWATGYDGNYAAMSTDLRASGGVKVKLKKVFTEQGKTVTNVEVI